MASACDIEFASKSGKLAFRSFDIEGMCVLGSADFLHTDSQALRRSHGS